MLLRHVVTCYMAHTDFSLNSVVRAVILMAYLNLSVCESERCSRANIVCALLHFPARLFET